MNTKRRELNTFSFTEMDMLTESGYRGAFVDDVKEGDAVAIKTFSRDDRPDVTFAYIHQLSVIPRFQTDEHGRVQGNNPLFRFIAVHENGMREPMELGSGWAIFIKNEEEEN
jgi:hypothetical protein